MSRSRLFLEVTHMSTLSRNYHAHGGAEWVVGGKLTFLPGAVVEGIEGLFDPLPGAQSERIPFIEDSKATTAAALREDYNRLLAALRAAGLMEPAPANETETGDAG